MDKEQSPEQSINNHRAEEVQILARMQMRSREDEKDEKRLHEIAGIISGISSVAPAVEQEKPEELAPDEEQRPA